MRLSWTQPICDTCWQERNPAREPVRVALGNRTAEVCAYCGTSTPSGIYVRANPDTVPYPATRED